MRIKSGQDHCYYCQNPVEKDGVCVGHWDFLYKNMSNRDRMIEKRYHRQMRAKEFQAKLDAHFEAQKAEVTT